MARRSDSVTINSGSDGRSSERKRKSWKLNAWNNAWGVECCLIVYWGVGNIMHINLWRNMYVWNGLPLLHDHWVGPDMCRRGWSRGQTTGRGERTPLSLPSGQTAISSIKLLNSAHQQSTWRLTNSWYFIRFLFLIWICPIINCPFAYKKQFLKGRIESPAKAGLACSKLEIAP